LREVLDENTLSNVEIVASDGSFEAISSNVQRDSDLKKAVGVLG